MFCGCIHGCIGGTSSSTGTSSPPSLFSTRPPCAQRGDWRWRGFWSRSQYQDSTLASRMASPNVPVSLCCSDAASARAASVRARRPAEVVKRCCVRHPQVGALPAACCSFVVAPVWPCLGSCLPPAPGSCKQGGKRGESATRLLPQTALAGPALWVKCWVKCWQRVRTLPPRVHVSARMRMCAYVSDVRWTLVRGC